MPRRGRRRRTLLVAASLLLLRAVTFTLCTAQVVRHFILFRTQTEDKLADRSGRETDRNVSNKLGREHVFFSLRNRSSLNILKSIRNGLNSLHCLRKNHQNTKELKFASLNPHLARRPFE